jgi:hypothetical protein
VTEFNPDFAGMQFADPASYDHLLAPESATCWWCRIRTATTGEHVFKRTALARMMDEDQVLIWGNGVKRHEIRGKGALKRDRYGVLKFPKSMCAPCNNEISRPFDIAYDIYAQHVNTHDLRFTSGLDLESLYGSG